VLDVTGVIPPLIGNYDIIKIIGLALVFVPIYIYLLKREYKVVRLLRINPFPLKYLFYTIGISICMYLFASAFDSLTITLIYQDPFSAFFAIGETSIWTSAAYWLISGVVIGIVFSGIIQPGLQISKPIKSCLITGFLYALFCICDSILFSEFSFSKLISFTACGFVFCYLSIKANSVIPAVISFIVFQLLNSIGLLDWYYSFSLYPLGLNYVTLIAIIAAVSILIGGFVLWKMPDNNKRSESSDMSVSIHENALQTNGSDMKKETGFIIAVALESCVIIASIAFYVIMESHMAV